MEKKEKAYAILAMGLLLCVCIFTLLIRFLLRRPKAGILAVWLPLGAAALIGTVYRFRPRFKPLSIAEKRLKSFRQLTLPTMSLVKKMRKQTPS